MQLAKKLIYVHPHTFEHLPKVAFLPLYESYNSFSKIFRDVFCFVLHPCFVPFFITQTGVILRNGAILNLNNLIFAPRVQSREMIENICAMFKGTIGLIYTIHDRDLFMNIFFQLFRVFQVREHVELFQIYHSLLKLYGRNISQFVIQRAIFHINQVSLLIIMDQQEIDELLKESFAGESQIKKVIIAEPSANYDDYSEEFDSYAASHTPIESQSKNQIKERKPLQIILEKKRQSQPTDKVNFKQKQEITFKTGPLQRPPSSQKKHLPYNYARIQERERELLFTRITQQNKGLKQTISQKEKEITALKQNYAIIRDQKAQGSSSVKVALLEKQLDAAQQRCHKLENLLKVAHEKRSYKPSAAKKDERFVSEEEFMFREKELIAVIDKLKDRLIASDRELKVLQSKLNDSNTEDFTHKLKRVEQLEYRIQKMTDQAGHDRELIEVLKLKNKDFEAKIQESHKIKQNLQLQIKRMELGQQTLDDCLKQLSEARKQKQLLEQSLKALSSGAMENAKSKIKKERPTLTEGQVVDLLYKAGQK